MSVPVGDLPGWTQIYAEDFLTDVAVGGIVAATSGSDLGLLSPSCAAYPAYGASWKTKATNSGDTSGNAKYNATKTMSVSGSVLDIYQHVETVSGVNQAYGGAIKPLLPSGQPEQTYGRYSFRARVQGVSGTRMGGVANVISSSGSWPGSGEDDWPEAAGGYGLPVGGFYHYADAANPPAHQVTTALAWTDWHIYTVEWSPGKIRYLADDVLVYESTDRVSTQPRGWLIQAGSTGGVPGVTETAHLQVDWIALYTYNAATVNGAAWRLTQLGGSGDPPGPGWRLTRLGGSGDAPAGATASWRLTRLGGGVAQPASATATAPAVSEPFQTVTITAVGTNVGSWLLTQTGGTHVTVAGSGPVWTYEAPATAEGDLLTFTVTGRSASGDATVNVQTIVEAVSEYDLVGSTAATAVWTPRRAALL